MSAAAGSLAAPLSSEEEAALLDALRDVVRELGVERVLTRPVILPDERHFPDRWSPTSLGVARLARRLLRFAGVAGDVAVLVTSEELVEEKITHGVSVGAFRASTWRTVGSPVSFAGIQSGDETCCVFTVDARYLDDPDFVVGATAREVAKAVRALEGGQGSADAVDAALEQKLVDVTGAALGFGVFFANDAHRIRSRGFTDGRNFSSEHKRTEAGALGPRAQSFLLAAVVAARGLDERPIKGVLETNQAAFFADALKRLRHDFAAGGARAHGLAARVGLPPSSSSPAAINLDALLAPLPSTGIYADVDDDVEAALDPVGSVVGALGVHEPAMPAVPTAAPAPRSRMNEGRPIFRVGASRAVPWGLYGFGVSVAGALLGVIAAGLPPAFLGAALVAAPLGLVAGRLRTFDECSDPACRAVIPAGAAVCPGCAGAVAGRIKHANERLDAEEKWRAASRRAAHPRGAPGDGGGDEEEVA